MATTTDVLEERVSSRATYAEPLSGLRISWGSVMAGTASFLAVSLLLWSLAFAIVMLATHASAASVKGSALALWICAMATTIVGAAVGGWLSGFLPGNPRRAVGAVHGFATWSVALLVSALVQGAMVGGALSNARAAAEHAMDTSMEGRGGAPSARAPSAGAPSAEGPSAGVPSDTRTLIARDLIDTGIGIGWSWFGTWAVALGVAVAAGGLGASTSDRIVPRFERERFRREVPVGGFRQAPTT